MLAYPNSSRSVSLSKNRPLVVFSGSLFFAHNSTGLIILCRTGSRMTPKKVSTAVIVPTTCSPEGSPKCQPARSTMFRQPEENTVQSLKDVIHFYLSFSQLYLLPIFQNCNTGFMISVTLILLIVVRPQTTWLSFTSSFLRQLALFQADPNHIQTSDVAVQFDNRCPNGLEQNRLTTITPYRPSPLFATSTQHIFLKKSVYMSIHLISRLNRHQFLLKNHSA